MRKANAALQPATIGTWLRSRPFLPGRAGVNSMYAEHFAPETAESIAAGDDWQLAPQLVDGKPHVFGKGQYTLLLPHDRSRDSTPDAGLLGSDDAIKVWCNGKLVLANNARRGVAANQERADLPLAAGRNELLIKIINYGGSSGLYFRRVEETVADLPSAVVQALRTAKGKRTAAHRRALQRQFRRERIPGYPVRGPSPEAPWKSLEQLRDAMRELVQEQLVDIMLMSASCSERLTIEERLFDDSPVTPAVRANDTSDIWCGLSSAYGSQPSLPFHTASIDQIQSGRNGCEDHERTRGADLGLYSITFNNDAALDREALVAYREFREQAEAKGFRHFLEVFAPNCPQNPIADVPRYVNDCIVRALAGVTRSARPLFLKIPYFGPEAMETLVHYDPTLVVGILGGSAGTALDAFQMLADAKRHGARVALFGRKINYAEHQPSFVRCLRAVADGDLDPVEAVRDYHGRLQQLGIPRNDGG